MTLEHSIKVYKFLTMCTDSKKIVEITLRLTITGGQRRDDYEYFKFPVDTQNIYRHDNGASGNTASNPYLKPSIPNVTKINSGSEA
jgi:hypothetical protein